MTNSMGRPKIKVLKPGFSLVEMIVVIAILGILLGVAIPTYLAVLPGVELKSDAKSIMFGLQRARQVASSYNRPTRFLLDCTPATINPGGSREACRVLVEIAVFDDTGLIQRWIPIQAGKMKLSPYTRFVYKSSYVAKKDQFDSYQKLFNGFYSVAGAGPRTYGVYNKDDFAGDSMVVVYAPNGEAVTYSKVVIAIASERKSTIPAWNLEIVNSTGYIRLREESV
ncbi:MAG: prepilin-type N-terminal cleavage/methylation domain-containing protein [Deltaproteobacteria bacterium]|jgi:prepilin-type N-terminal cleavage/methylation domain-containing protein|nr:prepilin-type N-terminal cleavage/methylation domain-containing protein [Deltaproteobacteria bacterium]